jgi:hypothetical protein
VERLVGALPGPYMHHLIYTYKNDVRTYVTRSSSYVVLELSPAQLGVPCARTVRQPGGALSLCARARPPAGELASYPIHGDYRAQACGMPACLLRARTLVQCQKQRGKGVHTYTHTYSRV